MSLVPARIERMAVTRRVHTKYGHLSDLNTAIFRDRLLRALKASGMSQRQLGRVSGVSQATISHLYMQKIRMVQESVVRRLAATLKLKINDLIEEV